MAYYLVPITHTTMGRESIPCGATTCVSACGWSKSGSWPGAIGPTLPGGSQDMCRCVVWRDIGHCSPMLPHLIQMGPHARTIHVHTLLWLQQVTSSRTRLVWLSGRHAHWIWIPLSICGISRGGQYHMCREITFFVQFRWKLVWMCTNWSSPPR